MRISMLLEREPFPALLKAALESFLPEISGESHCVEWRNRISARNSTPKGALGQKWVCNAYLNAIFIPGGSKSALEPVLNEYSRSTVWWRRPVQRAYVSLASTAVTARWLAQALLTITPGVPDAQDWLIMGGNHKIRLVNRTADRVYGIAKSEYDLTFVQREIQGRILAERFDVPVPSLRQSGELRAWFGEAYMSGRPLNRIGDDVAAQKTLLEAYGALDKFAKNTLRKVLLADYVSELSARLLQLLAATRVVPEAMKLRMQGDIGRLADWLFKGAPREFGICLSHGDFQPANIMVRPDGGIYLIDWEYSDYRQAGYDALVFGLRSRFPTGVAQRLAKFVSNGELAGFSRLPGNGLASWMSVPDRRVTACVFLLEELLLLLEENANPVLFSAGASLFAMEKEVQEWVRAM